MALELAVPAEGFQERKDRQLRVRLPERVYERLERFAKPEDSVSWMVRWFIETGLDRAEDEGMAGLIKAYWLRRGRVTGAGIGIEMFIDQERRDRLAPSITPVRS